MGMTVYNPDGTIASIFQGIERDGNKLVLKQLALGQVPMDVIITPEEGLKSLGMGMSLGLLTFILLFPCSSNTRQAKGLIRPVVRGTSNDLCSTADNLAGRQSMCPPSSSAWGPSRQSGPHPRQRNGPKEITRATSLS
jgi:hypothetical protein